MRVHEGLLAARFGTIRPGPRGAVQPRHTRSKERYGSQDCGLPALAERLQLLLREQIRDFLEDEATYKAGTRVKEPMPG